MAKLRSARKKPTRVVLSDDDNNSDDYVETPAPKKKATSRKPPPKPSSSILSQLKDAPNKHNGLSSSQQLPSRSRNGTTSISPRKRKTTAASTESPSKNQKISSFFTAAPSTQSTRTLQTNGDHRSLPSNISAKEDEIEDIEDDSPTEDSQSRKQSSFSSTQSGAKRKRDSVDAIPGEGLRRASHKFLKTNPIPPQNPSRIEDGRPWTERFGPISIDELAVHVKKVKDIRSWLENVYTGRERRRFLVLKGPAGAGKTTTISLLAKELGIEITEWRNQEAMETSEGFVSMGAKFDEFLRMAGKFGSLALSDGSGTVVSQSNPKNESTRKAILLEEFPTITSRSSTSQGFRNVVLQFLAQNTPSMGELFSNTASLPPPIPVILIITESLLASASSSADNFTAHRLLGQEILSHPGVTVIEFNPIAPTYMSKALELIIRKEARKSGRRRAPGVAVLKHLSTIGDIRSAVSSLHFLALRPDDEKNWSGRVTFTTKKRGAVAPEITAMERESLELITQRENTLNIFHAVGKVVHNKRDDPPPGTIIPQPPNWFSQHWRYKTPQNNVDDILNELGTDISTFIAALHENYVLSCSDTDTEATLDSVCGCLDALSDADSISPEGFGVRRRRFQGGSVDELRQDEMSFHLAVRGLLFNLPNPVKRLPPPNASIATGTGSRTDAFKMFYPASARVWRKQEEIGAVLDLVATEAMKGRLAADSGAMASRPKFKETGVAAWNRAATSRRPPIQAEHSDGTQSDRTEDAAVLKSVSKGELLLEILPYLAAIRGKTRGAFHDSIWKHVENLTKIRHEEVQVDEETDDEDIGEGPGNAVGTKLKRSKEPVEEMAEEKLFLSDDDIED
ncbi:hypothetical protein P152DRAFT_513026 [Eremomyces bilateralis CBS 781.70]|uniref:Checkpoint protein RAD24-like helical bundle domain-containing protein n=1 Tax=Eremomyces bilateralis CBS 781.70 TaxID=1392243 RepID=A0A6G1G685_9PEZI|nr:uncharacterized protein P152DRAFT_513026 [Eremomyces bilateralis CBS 781.70]KAF1813605.1 hypothetical protein P152DRAFT_513026 [Eremomyces bilateralis CBS 781.70]